jgi:hypothetical protein
VSPQNLAAQELASGRLAQKPKANIYTMMLILSFIAVCIACVLLWLELQVYAPYPWWETKQVAPATSSLYTPASGLAAELVPYLRA